AADVSAGAGDVSSAFKAIDLLAAEYQVDPMKLKADAHTLAAKFIPTPEAFTQHVAAGRALLNEALAVDRYKIALQASASLIGVTRVASKAASVAPLARYLAFRSQQVKTFRNDHSRLGNQVEARKQTPNDPAANLALGRFYCFDKGDWDVGLPMLALGEDEVLREAAQLDLTWPADPVTLQKLGRRWWQAAEDQKPRAVANAVRIRAYRAYREAFSKLDKEGREGLRKQMQAMQGKLAPHVARYLSNMPESSSSVGYGSFGKKGFLGYESNDVTRIIAGGSISPNGLSTHPAASSTAFVTYHLFGEFGGLQLVAAIADTTTVSPLATPLAFRVVGDGKTLWSASLAERGTGAVCEIN
ncbi:MAG: NPCBM/NEW2 domain-containing protein, partial [Planctomycetales bacterium]